MIVPAQKFAPCNLAYKRGFDISTYLTQMNPENSQSLLDVAQAVRKEHQDELNKLESEAAASEAKDMRSGEIKEPSTTAETSNEQLNT